MPRSFSKPPKLVQARPPHPATVVQLRPERFTPRVAPRPPHPATVAAPEPSRVSPGALPAHSASALQAKLTVPSTAPLGAEHTTAGVQRVLQRMEAAGATIHVKRQELRGAQAVVATITDAHRAHYYVPDGGKPSVGWDQERLRADLPGYIEKSAASPPWKEYLRSMNLESIDSQRSRLPELIPLDAIEAKREQLVPLRTLKGWYDFFQKRKKQIPLMVNANWFSIQGPGGYPHAVPFTYLMGLSVKKGKVVSPFDLPTEHGEVLDALVVFDRGSHRDIKILTNEQISQRLAEVQFAVGGFSILADSQCVDRSAVKSANYKVPKRRTGAGISKDGTQLHLVVVETEITLPVLCEIFLSLGDSDAINLDNSGSSQMVWNGEELTKPADKVEHLGLGASLRYRPIPNFFAVSDKPIKKNRD